MKIKPLFLVILNLLLVWGVWTAVQSNIGSDLSSLLGEEMEEMLEKTLEEECFMKDVFDVFRPVFFDEYVALVDLRRLNKLECVPVRRTRGFIFGWRVPLRI